MSGSNLTQLILLPKLKLLKAYPGSDSRRFLHYDCEIEEGPKSCPVCSNEKLHIHSYRFVRIKDAPIRGRIPILNIRKKRLRCLACKKVFTEALPGISQRARMTERMHREIMYVCQRFSSLKEVRAHTSCGNSVIYRKYYNELERNLKEKQNTPWPRTIGIDEHSFTRNPQTRRMEFVTSIVDYNNGRIKEVLPSRVSGQLQMALKHFPGRENVKNVCMDLSSTYRSFAQAFFPNAQIIADKFHVLRLINPTLNRYRKQVTGDRRSLKIRRLLLVNSAKIDSWTRKQIWRWLEEYPELKELYTAKEALQRLYRCHGYNKAKRSLIGLLDWLADTKIKELQTLRNTLLNWQGEILNYFKTKLTNARTEGFNNVAKSIIKRAYGFRSFKNYRLRLLESCY